MRGIYVYGWLVGYLPSATGIEAMHLRLLIALALLLGVPESSVAAPDSVSPDGSRSYTCRDERESAEGCFNTWTKLTHQGRSEGWVPAYCSDQRDQYSQGHCYQGGVPWWWWVGAGRIGDPVLKEFWFRDYAGPEINGVFRNDNPYGDARRLPGELNCYQAKQSTFCMEHMRAPTDSQP
jgi:hypothetical protein